jgi:hypothetical protein
VDVLVLRLVGVADVGVARCFLVRVDAMHLPFRT